MTTPLLPRRAIQRQAAAVDDQRSGSLPTEMSAEAVRRLGWLALGYAAANLKDPERLAMFINAWNLWRQEKETETIHVVYGVRGGGSAQPLTNYNYPAPK